ncbi:MAG TPA: DUF983 domain-containing protein, partial [Acidimicrobiales bacterium]|nr:DUF983 domain-containing protein [Acidimicrobiales bacterium]
DSAPPDASPTRMVLRGLVHRCPRCGGRNVFRTFFTMRERCPECGMRFIRHEGFSLGSTTINMVVTFGMFLAIVVVGMVATYPHVQVIPVTIAGLAVAIIVPIVFYPSAQTIWSGLDLAMRPLDPVEQAEAATFVEAQRHGDT